MSNKKILSALCYLSVLFFPLLIPFIVYFITDESEVKFHAKRSFISHIIPMILLVIGFMFFSLSMFSVEKRMFAMFDSRVDFWSVAPFLFTILYSILFIAIFIWNIYYGIKMLKY